MYCCLGGPIRAPKVTDDRYLLFGHRRGRMRQGNAEYEDFRLGRRVFTWAKPLNWHFCRKYLIFWLILHVLTLMFTQRMIYTRGIYFIITFCHFYSIRDNLWNQIGIFPISYAPTQPPALSLPVCLFIIIKIMMSDALEWVFISCLWIKKPSFGYHNVGGQSGV